jgi:hypothetical protein
MIFCLKRKFFGNLNPKNFGSSVLISTPSFFTPLPSSKEGPMMLTLSRQNQVPGSLNRDSIGATFVSHFTNLLSSTNPSISDEMLDLFSPIITKDDSLNLC